MTDQKIPVFIKNIDIGNPRKEIRYQLLQDIENIEKFRYLGTVQYFSIFQNIFKIATFIRLVT